MSEIPRCLGCGDKLVTWSGHASSSDQKTAEASGALEGFNNHLKRGCYGNGVTCSYACSHLVASRLIKVAEEKGIDIKGLLPDEWRPDLIPWPAWRAAAKINGKRSFVVPRKR